MRDLVAGILAVVLLLLAASLATTLRFYRRRRQRARDCERALGRTLIAELPTAEELVLFSEDAKRFYYGERSIDKDLIAAVRVLINGAPIAAVTRRQANGSAPALVTQAEEDDWRPPTRDRPSTGSERPERTVEGPAAGAAAAIEDRAEGIARDRWDVTIETVTGAVLVECGAIRERVSQELARAVFDAVTRSIREGRNVTTRFPARRRDD